MNTVKTVIVIKLPRSAWFFNIDNKDKIKTGQEGFQEVSRKIKGTAGISRKCWLCLKNNAAQQTHGVGE